VSNLVTKAVNFAFTAHEGQLRKFTKLPYVMHPVRVAFRVSVVPGATEEMVAAAVLHDVLEDTPTEQEDIEAEFGPVVAGLVSELTNTTKGMQFSRAHRKKMDRERIATTSREARIIKLVDRIDNLREVGQGSPEYRKMYAGESLLLLEAIGNVGPEAAFLRDEFREAALAAHGSGR